MVYFEIQNWLMKNKSRNKIEIFQKICAAQGIGVIDKDILDIAITEKLKLQEKGFSIEDDDLLIAAYCLKHKLTLITSPYAPERKRSSNDANERESSLEK
jgi:predicted nucleic acid-binding protein